jgi:ribonuclease T1
MAGPTLAPALPSSNLPTITVAQLPPEGRTTLALIASNGPFPYRKDGVVFSNRERRLPKQDYGWYHEYTVVTPGSSDRGARRIISGRNGERYYTADHYGSFREVIQGESGS